jgi:hypothetical protein
LSLITRPFTFEDDLFGRFAGDSARDQLQRRLLVVGRRAGMRRRSPAVARPVTASAETRATNRAARTLMEFLGLTVAQSYQAK